MIHFNKTKDYRLGMKKGDNKGSGFAPQYTLREFADSMDKNVNHLNQLCRYYPLPIPANTVGPNHCKRYPIPSLKQWWNNIPEEKRNPK